MVLGEYDVALDNVSIFLFQKAFLVSFLLANFININIISYLFQYDASEMWFDVDNIIIHDQYQVKKIGSRGIIFETENITTLYICVFYLVIYIDTFK